MTPESRAVLRDLLLSLDAPTSLREARRWAERHARGHAALWALLDEAERPRREAFEALVLAVIGRGEYPSAAEVREEGYVSRRVAGWSGLGGFSEAGLRYECRRWFVGSSFNADELRWRTALLARLGWRKGHTGRWFPPKVPQ